MKPGSPERYEYTRHGKAKHIRSSRTVEGEEDSKDDGKKDQEGFCSLRERSSGRVSEGRETLRGAGQSKFSLSRRI